MVLYPQNVMIQDVKVVQVMPPFAWFVMMVTLLKIMRVHVSNRPSVYLYDVSMIM